MKEMRIGIDYTGEVFRVVCPRCGSEEAKSGWHWNDCGAVEVWSRCEECGNEYYHCSGGCWNHPRAESGDERFYDECQSAPIVEHKYLYA